MTPLCDGANLTTFEPADGKDFYGVGNIHKNPEDDTDATYRRWFRVSDGQATLVKTFDDLAWIDLRASPDRKRVVLLGRTAYDESSDTSLLVYDADGTGEKKLFIWNGDGQQTRLLGWFPAKPQDPRKKNAPVPKAADKRVVWSEPVRVDWQRSRVEQITGVWTPDGKSVVVPAATLTAKGEPLPGGGIDFREAETGKVTDSLRYVTGKDTAAFQPAALAIIPDGKTVAAAGAVYDTAKKAAPTHGLHLWSGPKERDRIERATDGSVSALAASADGKRLAAVTVNRVVEVRETSTGKLLWTNTLGPKVGQLAGLAYDSANSSLWVGGSAGEVRAMEAATGRTQLSLVKSGMKIRAVAMSADGKITALGGQADDSGTALVLLAAEAPAFKDVVPTKERINGLAFAPDGKHLAAASSDGVVRVFELEGGKLAASAKEHDGPVFSVAYSPDGKRLLTVGKDAVQVWDVEELMKAK